MQANSTINQSAPDAYIEKAGSTWAQSDQHNIRQIAGADARAITTESELRDLLASLDSQFYRPRLPYSLRSARSKANYQLCKEVMDVVGSLVLLALVSPLFVIIAFAIKITSNGPVFYKHKRLGQLGREFWCLKFRTMAVDAEEQLRRNPELRQQFEVSYKIKYDPRVTRLGGFMRKTSLDEIPQLINVLLGDMSLIGPRPIVSPELSKYSIYGKKLLSVKPGLSGLWQVCGRSDVDYPERVFMDMHYINHRCLWLDLQLMLRTPLAVFRGHGAC